MNDRKSREAIRTELDVNMMVEAAAGTGKTTSLVTRIAELLRTGRCSTSSVAAITFTVKAAAQLRERLHEALGTAVAGAVEPVERQRLLEALDGLDRAYIGTTHSFCARLLRERPVESGLDPEFREADEVTAQLMLADFWHRWYDAQRVRNAASVAKCAEAGLKGGSLQGAFARLVEYADVEIVATPCAQPDLRLAVDAVLSLVGECEAALPDDTMRETPDKFELLIRELRLKRTSLDLDDVTDQLTFLQAADHATRKPTQKNWPDKKQAKAFGERYADLAQTVIRPAIRRWREYVHCIAIDFLRPAVEEYEQERIRAGAVTFSDLLVRARNLLRDHPHVRSYFQRRFTHVFVDEFQDTDPIQAELLFFLTGEQLEERNWRKLTPRPGSLFIVGDPKQSIYRFRRADITTYLTVKDLLAKSGGRVEQLTTNFRSARSICEMVNHAFPLLFAADDVAERRQAPHVDLDPQHDGDETSGVYALELQDAKQETVAEEEARCVAEWIERAVKSGQVVSDGAARRPAGYGDFLLVSAYTHRLSIYAHALEQRGIPFEITGGGAFTDSRELRDLLPLLRAAADPDDVLSLVAFLRGPRCGASDNALYHFAKSGGRFSLFATPPEGSDEAIVNGLAIAAAAVEAARTLPPGAALSRIVERVALPASAAVHEPAGLRAGNVMLTEALARSRRQTGDSFAEVVEVLGELVDSSTKIEELDIDPLAVNVVRLMNLHQVKGLEAPVVFLIDPVEERDYPPDLHVNRSGDVSQGHFAIFETNRNTFKKSEVALPSGWDSLSQVEQQFQRAERKRLIYVAATRAKSILVVGTRMKDGLRHGMWAPLAARARRLFGLEGHTSDGGPAVPGGDTLASARSAIEVRKAAATTESYSVLPVTKIAHENQQALVRAEEGLGKGTSWGRVLHRLFEAMLRDASLDLSAYAASLLKDEERDAADHAEVMKVVDAVRGSGLWSRVVEADERMAEVPFALNVARRDVGLDGDGETLLHGTVDLVFREGDRWFIVDYKSDSTSGRLEELVAYYRPQVELYARFWASLTGATTTGGLYFVDGCHERWI